VARLFQTDGAETPNARSPKQVLVRWSTHVAASDEQRAYIITVMNGVVYNTKRELRSPCAWSGSHQTRKADLDRLVEDPYPSWTYLGPIRPPTALTVLDSFLDRGHRPSHRSTWITELNGSCPSCRRVLLVLDCLDRWRGPAKSVLLVLDSCRTRLELVIDRWKCVLPNNYRDVSQHIAIFL